MTNEIHENDVVALLIDLPEAGLHRGDVGTVIQLFESTASHPGGFIVEFIDELGNVQGETDITDPAQIVRLRFRLIREAA